MHPLVPWLWAAGGVQLLIASANFFAPHVLEYPANLEKVTPIVRQIFIVHTIYIVLVLATFAGLCFGFATDLAGASALGRYCSGFLAFFWGLRIFLQLFFYDSATKRQYPVFNLLFLGAFIYLTGTFTVAALGLLE
jgi:hypothetical protein